MPAATSAAKVALIEAHGGRCHFVQNPARSTPRRSGSRARPAATTWTSSPTPSGPPTGAATTTSPSRSTTQMRDGDAPHPGLDRGRRGHRRNQRDDRPLHPLPAPRHPVVRRRPGELGVLPGLRRRSTRRRDGASSRIEGIGRPRVEPSFLPGVVDRMVAVPDAASIAPRGTSARVLGRRVGPSTGTNLWGAFGLLAEMVAEGRSGSVVTLLADSGDRYTDTYFSDDGSPRRDWIPPGPPRRWSNSSAPVGGRPDPRFGRADGRCDRLSWLQAGCGAAW